MSYPLSKTYVDGHLGEQIRVNDNEEGIIAYEHNRGSLALYDNTGNRFIRYLTQGDSIIFATGDGIERVLDEEIRE